MFGVGVQSGSISGRGAVSHGPRGIGIYNARRRVTNAARRRERGRPRAPAPGFRIQAEEQTLFQRPGGRIGIVELDSGPWAMLPRRPSPNGKVRLSI
jgi:hypothetical protein